MKLNEIKDVGQWLNSQVKAVQGKSEWDVIFDDIMNEILSVPNDRDNERENPHQPEREDVKEWIKRLESDGVSPHELGDIRDVALAFYDWWDN